jgi:DNA-directed RNA polymerase specialized sigma subunit
MALIRKPLNQMNKKELVAYVLTIEFLYFNIKDELEPLKHLIPHMEELNQTHRETIHLFHQTYEQEKYEQQLISPVYATEEPTIDMDRLQEKINQLDISKRTREVLQSVNEYGNQEQAAEALGISQSAVAQHISKARQQAKNL